MNIWKPEELTKTDKDFNFLQVHKAAKGNISCKICSGLSTVTVFTEKKTVIAGIRDNITQMIYVSNGDVQINDKKETENLFETYFTENAKDLPEDVKKLFAGNFGIG